MHGGHAVDGDIAVPWMWATGYERSLNFRCPWVEYDISSKDRVSVFVNRRVWIDCVIWTWFNSGYLALCIAPMGGSSGKKRSDCFFERIVFAMRGSRIHDLWAGIQAPCSIVVAHSEKRVFLFMTNGFVVCMCIIVLEMKCLTWQWMLWHNVLGCWKLQWLELPHDNVH